MKYPSNEARNIINHYIKDNAINHRPPLNDFLLIKHIENIQCESVLAAIRDRQKGIKKLWRDENGFLAIWGATTSGLVKGCRACLFGKLSHVRSSIQCSQNCDFCFYYKQNLNPIPKGMYQFTNAPNLFTATEAKLLITRQIEKYDAIGWLQREPLEEIEKLPEIMAHIASTSKHTWQFLYTNGVHATEYNLKLLADSGLNEIRFNLQATDFSSTILKRMKFAVELGFIVLIETPIFSKSFKNFIKNKSQILDIGITQFNAAELQVCGENYELFKKTEGKMYKHRKGNVSPISSRQFTYDLIYMAEREDWPFVILDCSNETKYFRGTKNGELGSQLYGEKRGCQLSKNDYLALIPDDIIYEF